MKWLKILIVNVAEICQPKTKKNKQTNKHWQTDTLLCILKYFNQMWHVCCQTFPKHFSQIFMLNGKIFHDSFTG